MLNYNRMNELETLESVFSSAWFAIVVILVAAWVTVWKGLALWKAAGLKQKFWFIFFLIVNTMGIGEIIYLIVQRKK